MSEQLPAGPELDALVCRALTAAGAQGFAISPRFIVSRDGGETGINWSDDRNELVAFLREHPEFLRDSFTIVQIEGRCAAISTDWREAGRALEAMKALGWRAEISQKLDGWVVTEYPECWFTVDKPAHHPHQVGHDDFAACVALAILAALEGK